MSEEQIKPLIQEVIKSSMKNGQKEKTITLRMAISEIQREEIDKRSGLSNQEVIAILLKMIKQRKDSSNQFKSAGREELSSKEEREIETLSEFLPEQLSEDEIKKIVFNAIESVNAKTPQDIGKVMGSLKSDLQGQADMSLVIKLVKENLTE